MKELSIFIDESGDFGEYSHHSPYYIITMVFHNQNLDIQEQIKHLNTELSYLGLDNLCIHTGPIIRKEEIYKDMDIIERHRVFNKMMAFIREHYNEFLEFDDVKIYYDNGQIQVSRLLSSVFNVLLQNPVFRKVMPSDYKLFQVADFICTMELIKLKIEKKTFFKIRTKFFW